MSGTRRVSLLTGGRDRPYALGLSTALIHQGIALDFIGSDELDDERLRMSPLVRFLNLRGDQRRGAGFARKALRVVAYYIRLIRYAASARPTIFHLLWNNKFEVFDRTALMLYYKLLGKRVVLTVHNVNAAERDGKDTILNRATLWLQYRLADHLFVHTEKMKQQVASAFAVPDAAVTVVPFGINNAVPVTSLTRNEARAKLGLTPNEPVLLFFGKIGPYKGLEFLVDAFRTIETRCTDCRLIIAGSPRGGSEDYWRAIEQRIIDSGSDRVIRHIGFVPDEETEVYFKAADVLVLPYTHVFQSGVLFLGYSFGVPVVASDVGSLAEDVIEGETGFVCRPGDVDDLVRALLMFLDSRSHDEGERRSAIREFALARHSWDVVAQRTIAIYEALDGRQLGENAAG